MALPAFVRLLQLYYLITPIFLIVDLLGAPIRMAALTQNWRVGYYVAAFVLGMIMRRRPALAAPLGLLESSLNILLLVLSIMLPIWAVYDQALAGAPLELGLGPATFVNFLLAAPIAVVTFRRRQALLRGNP